MKTNRKCLINIYLNPSDYEILKLLLFNDYFKLYIHQDHLNML